MGNSGKFPLDGEFTNTQVPQSLPGLSSMPRFVVLVHEMPVTSARQLHWDFMLEQTDTLATWALDKAPKGGETIPCQLLADHRKHYLDYEGPVSGDRGHVRQWDRGSFKSISLSTTQICVYVDGDRLQGTVTLSRVSDGWQFTFQADNSASAESD